MTRTEGDLKTGRATRWVLVAVMAVSWVASCDSAPPAPAPKPETSAPKQDPTSCQFTLGEEQFTADVCRFQFLPADPKRGRPKPFLQVTNFSISAETYPSLQLIAHVDVTSPDELTNQSVTAKAIILRAAEAEPLASKKGLTIRFTRAEAPYLEGTFEGTVQAAGGKKETAVSGQFHARPL